MTALQRGKCAPERDPILEPWRAPIGVFGFETWGNLIFGSWENWVVCVALTSVVIYGKETS